MPTAYNKVNGDYASSNLILLNDVLKSGRVYRSWVISDWGAIPNWESALNGFDQECAAQLDAVF
ncbi:hypothetical protein DIJ64_14340 [Mycobacterium leprae]|uniref:Uncharacterized protein n=1 Tax=Mycobacterium leprae TaxID=1769 RepID=A0AAD0P7M0_MYCLR|nr:hypothetical protein [Mycobacterium leprae]AWV48817.1 hypothetical protein DIJ64_14340 [Mycobacterium leprae]OAR20306.1 hypothetical protein A8144_11385 [Mycobacterium leprae 3125609]OAX70629.1 hypothetical protein A3216_10925 [Mycobacterium leprae 7935681]